MTTISPWNAYRNQLAKVGIGTAPANRLANVETNSADKTVDTKISSSTQIPYTPSIPANPAKPVNESPVYTADIGGKTMTFKSAYERDYAIEQDKKRQREELNKNKLRNHLVNVRKNLGGVYDDAWIDGFVSANYMNFDPVMISQSPSYYNNMYRNGWYAF